MRRIARLFFRFCGNDKIVELFLRMGFELSSNPFIIDLSIKISRARWPA